RSPSRSRSSRPPCGRAARRARGGPRPCHLRRAARRSRTAPRGALPLRCRPRRNASPAPAGCQPSKLARALFAPARRDAAPRYTAAVSRPSSNRGIAPELLLSQIRNTAPYVFGDEPDAASIVATPPAAFVRSLDPEALGALSHAGYFRLCLS